MERPATAGRTTTTTTERAGPRLLTVGHGTASEQELLSTLGAAGVELLVDIRRFPGSRRHPHLGKDSLPTWLTAGGVGYRWEPRLGGRRRLPPGAASADTWWTVEAFRAYAAHTRSAEFAAGLDELLAEARSAVVAVMCSETVWWRCHRRLVADVVVLAHQGQVEHVLAPGPPRRHRPATGARLDADGQVVWDGPGT